MNICWKLGWSMLENSSELKYRGLKGSSCRHNFCSSPVVGRRVKLTRWNDCAMWDAWARWEIITTYLGENVMGKDTSEDTVVEGSVILKWICGTKMKDTCWHTLFRTSYSGRLFWKRSCAVEIHKYRVFLDRLIDSQCVFHDVIFFICYSFGEMCLWQKLEHKKILFIKFLKTIKCELFEY